MRSSSVENRTSKPVVSGPIRRLLIFHLDLAHQSLGRPLDEGASEAELSESILYYRTLDSLDANVENDRCARTAIQFAGLCSALYKLPNAVDTVVAETGGQAKEVYFDHCTLVFETLEDPDIVAVAEVSRRTASSFGGTPVAVCTALSRTHILFRLLRGGGILARLGNYDGMKQLYDFRKKERELDAIGRQQNPVGEREGAKQEVESTINYSLLTLPIVSLREDLRIHYDTFLSELSVIAREYSGVCRSIVECVPSSVHLVSATPGTEDDVLEQIATLKLSVQGYLRKSQIGTMLGVSAFMNGSFLFTEEREGTNFANEATTLLFSYMWSIRSKMLQTIDHSASSSSQNGTFHPLTFGSDTAEVSMISEPSMTASCRYLPPPSLSLLSASDDANAVVHVEDRAPIWAPLIAFPGENRSILWARVCLFETSSMIFLIYFQDQPNADDESDEQLSVELVRFSDLMTSSPVASQNAGDNRPKATSKTNLGRDIVLINRSKQSLKLVLHPRTRNTTKTRLRFFAPKLYSTRARSNSTASTNHSALRCDGRYILASGLSLDAMLAFDDAMGELRIGHPFEMCSLLPHFWVYAYTDCETELYVFFDSKACITIADVQNAAEHIRNEVMTQFDLSVTADS